jgi:hypothetical protein
MTNEELARHFQAYTKTMDLRIYNGTLQQKHQGDKGDCFWKDVEIVIENMDSDSEPKDNHYPLAD